MRVEHGALLLWLSIHSNALQAAPAAAADDLAFLEFLALMIEDEDDWIDPLTALEALPAVPEPAAETEPGAEAEKKARDPQARESARQDPPQARGASAP